MRRPRKVRRRIFFACEGDSENAFRAWLQELCEQHELHVHLDGARLRGGDPLALVEGALKHRRGSESAAGVSHRHSLLCIDNDRLGDGSKRSQEAARLAEASGLALIRQVPCFEGVLLRLRPGHEGDVPTDARQADRRLRRVWPEYSKPTTRRQLANRFSFADLQRLARVDVGICRLLDILGLPRLP